MNITRCIAAAAVALAAWPLFAGAQAGDPAAAAAANARKAAEDAQNEKMKERDREAQRLQDEALLNARQNRERQLQALQAKDQAVLDQPRQLLERLLQLPATLKLSPEHRTLAEATLQPLRSRAAAAWPAWRDEALARAATATGGAEKTKVKAEGLPVEPAALLLSIRTLNEAALWFADAQPHASDALWIEALRREGLCQGLDGTEPAARMAILIDALPPERRAEAWAGEAARLARWGQPTRSVPLPADRALEDSLTPLLTAAALPRTLAAMPAALRATLQAPGWSLASQTAAGRCELLRWWSQEQVRRKEMTARQAMLAWRSALAVRSADYLLTTQPRSGAQALDNGGFPQVARTLELSGKVVVEQDVDASGRVLHSFIQRRELRAASLGELPPLALEREFDAATLDRIAAMPARAPDAASLRDGVATRRLGIEWVVN